MVNTSNSFNEELNVNNFPNQTTNKMAYRAVKRKLLKAKISLSQTLQKILEINKNRKNLTYIKNTHRKQETLNEELKVLNKTAEFQNKLIQKYEKLLSGKRA
jgi:uncharacterized protein YutE (UPF0331/DUF86 family)